MDRTQYGKRIGGSRPPGTGKVKWGRVWKMRATRVPSMSGRRRCATFVVMLFFIVMCGVPHSQEIDNTGGDYTVGAQDGLQIVVWNNEELTRFVPVRPNGRISLPLLDDVRAVGKTPTELRKAIALGLSDFISDPVLSVIVSEIRSFEVSVLGGVARPERYDLDSTDDRSRDSGDGPRIRPLRVSERYPGAEIAANWKRSKSDSQVFGHRQGKQANLEVKPGDLVIVP